MSVDNRAQILRTWRTGGTAVQGFLVAPGSGATITIWDSNADGKTPHGGVRFKRIMVNLVSSAVSAANGLSFEESYDDGTNWDVVVQYTTAANTHERKNVSMWGPRQRVTFTNSAAVLTVWRGCCVGDEYERATQ